MKKSRAHIVLQQLQHYSVSGRLFLLRPRHETDKVVISAYVLDTLREAAEICIQAGLAPSCAISGEDGCLDHRDIISISPSEYNDLISKLEQVQQSTSTPTR